MRINYFVVTAGTVVLLMADAPSCVNSLKLPRAPVTDSDEAIA